MYVYNAMKKKKYNAGCYHISACLLCEDDESFINMSPDCGHRYNIIIMGGRNNIEENKSLKHNDMRESHCHVVFLS